MDGMLSIFCTLRPSAFESEEFEFEIRVANEGKKALKNFAIIAYSSHGFKFKNSRELFRTSQLKQEVRLLRSDQVVTFTFHVRKNLDSTDGAISVRAVPPAGCANKARLEVEMFRDRALQTSA
jgi:hypothetical protein